MNTSFACAFVLSFLAFLLSWVIRYFVCLHFFFFFFFFFTALIY